MGFRRWNRTLRQSVEKSLGYAFGGTRDNSRLVKIALTICNCKVNLSEVVSYKGLIEWTIALKLYERNMKRVEEIGYSQLRPPATRNTSRLHRNEIENKN